ncbi:hypothetical protein MRX96_000827 [Rhipicephalus microplus]
MATPPYPDVFGESRYFITSEHMKAFRARLLGEHRGRETAAYHSSDRRRILDSDEYCWRFIVHNRLDLERAVRMADAALKWRAKVRLHELTESSLPRSCLQAGFVYPFNVDRYGNHVLLLRPANIRSLPMADVPSRTRLLRGDSAAATERLAHNTARGLRRRRPPPAGPGSPWRGYALSRPATSGHYVDRDKLPVRMGGARTTTITSTCPEGPWESGVPSSHPWNPVTCPTASLHVYGMFTA